MVATETDKDAELGPIKRDVLTQVIDSPYTLNYEILFKNERVVIPQNLQEQVLQVRGVREELVNRCIELYRETRIREREFWTSREVK